jgi:alkanesulfonate monooxygenase SsuD/methylene tetrahydromethanopterin reductase-like flavin-dependent oxidoreductase (luciferase family)
MRYAITVPNIGELDPLVTMAVEADAAGWDGFFLWDHMRFTKDFPVSVFDPWVTLGAIAVRTERIRIGTMITPIPRRRPWKLARETVTLDHLSGGRVILGVGLGYPPDADFELLGEDPDERVRAEKLDEGLELLERFWRGEPFDFDGRHFHVREAQFLPTPVQVPRIPIWVAGMWPNRAPFRRAARFDGVCPIGVVGDEGIPADLGPEDLAAVIAYIREHRGDRGSFDVAAGGVGLDAERIAAYEEAGATWYFPSAGVEGPDWAEPTLELIRCGPPR